MSNGASADLQSIAHEMTGLLEARISDLLGHVKAAREVTQQMLETDGEITKLAGTRARLQAVLAPLDGEEGPETADLRKRLDQVEARVRTLEVERRQLTDRLELLKSKLHA